MIPSTTDDVLSAAGPVGDALNFFVSQCVEHGGQPSLLPPVSPASLASSSGSAPSTLSFSSLSTDASDTIPYVVSDYEKAAYYHGVVGNGDHPILIYRSNYEVPFLKPCGGLEFAQISSKSICDVYGTSLTPVWHTIGPQIRDVVKSLGVYPFCIDPARFVSCGGEDNGDGDSETLSPPVVWVGVPPNSVSPDAAHATSQRILALLAANGAKDVVVEWREAVLSQLAGPALMPLVDDSDPTASVRRPFTSALNIPVSTKEGKEPELEGSLTLYFHENKDSHGQPSTAVLAVSNSHVLRRNTKDDYRLEDAGTSRQCVRSLSTRGFQKALDDIQLRTDHYINRAAIYVSEIRRLEAIGVSNENELAHNRTNLEDAQKASAALERFHNDIVLNCGSANDRDIGFLRITKAVAVSVEDGTYFTEDWGALELDEAKFKSTFAGMVINLPAPQMPLDIVTTWFYPQSESNADYLKGRMYEITSVALPEHLAHPDMCNSKGQPCLVVGKDGARTGLTFGRYAGLESYLCEALGVASVELGIYKWGGSTSAFADKGDSGALIWDSHHRAVGQLHSSASKGKYMNSHVIYATPAWWLLERIKHEFPDAVFFSKTWSL